MTEKRAFIAFGVAAALAEVIVINGLTFLGVDSETQAKACMILLSAAGLGGGLLFMRYH